MCVCIYTLMNLFFAKINRYPENKFTCINGNFSFNKVFFNSFTRRKQNLDSPFTPLILWFLIIENLALRNV